MKSTPVKSVNAVDALADESPVEHEHEEEDEFDLTGLGTAVGDVADQHQAKQSMLVTKSMGTTDGESQRGDSAASADSAENFLEKEPEVDVENIAAG